ncbi:MAG TPA: toll/interleukin-1 receptor domain-containing protein [Vicinamibacterales bacterium]|nr:toll/interleukin-1 receptor domain-containing protein [Vicinamibacterales bacterium]
MGAIFINYRRADGEGQAGRLSDDLARTFGRGAVYMDVTTIEPGRDFRRVIDEQVASCAVLLAVIGKNWISASGPANSRRIDDPHDFVRIEIAAALRREIPVIPVLIQGATLPSPGELPEDLKELVFRNAVELTHARWESDVAQLTKALSRYVSIEGSSSDASVPSGRLAVVRSPPMAIGAAIVLLALASTIYLWTRHPDPATAAPAVLAQAPAPDEKPAALPQQTSPASSRTSPTPGVSLVGTWRAPDLTACGDGLRFEKDDGSEVLGSCDNGNVIHSLTGRYDQLDHVRFTITRTVTKHNDPAYDCVTSTTGTIQILDRNRIRTTQEPWPDEPKEPRCVIPFAQRAAPPLELTRWTGR